MHTSWTLVTIEVLLAAVPAAGFCSLTSVQEASKAWTESRDGKSHFQLLLRVPDPWQPFAHIMLEWQEQVDIGSVMGARLVRKADDKGSVAEFELDGVRPSARSIQVSGTGTLDVQPTVVCRALTPPPPAPPHAEYCSMSPAYKVVRMWAEACIIEVSLEYWEDAKLFTLTFMGEEVHVNRPKESVVNAEFVDEDTMNGDTIVRVRLVPKDFLHGGKLIFSIQLAPPPHKDPRIECHAPWRPPPPPPPPLPAPPPRPPPEPRPPPLPVPHPPSPPPPIFEIAASKECRLGGSMKIESIETIKRSGADFDTARIVVRLDRWEANNEVLTVLKHAWNSDFGVTDLARTALISQALEPAADATLLIFKPSPPTGGSSPFFGFNVQGRDVQLGRLSCRVAAAPPPSPPPFVFKLHKNKHVASIGVPTTSTKSDKDPDQPLGATFAGVVLVAAFLFMFKDVIVRAPQYIVLRLKGHCPGYGSVGTVETDLNPGKADVELSIARAPPSASATPVGTPAAPARKQAPRRTTAKPKKSRAPATE